MITTRPRTHLSRGSSMCHHASLGTPTSRRPRARSHPRHHGPSSLGARPRPSPPHSHQHDHEPSPPTTRHTTLAQVRQMRQGQEIALWTTDARNLILLLGGTVPTHIVGGRHHPAHAANHNMKMLMQHPVGLPERRPICYPGTRASRCAQDTTHRLGGTKVAAAPIFLSNCAGVNFV